MCPKKWEAYKLVKKQTMHCAMPWKKVFWTPPSSDYIFVFGWLREKQAVYKMSTSSNECLPLTTKPKHFKIKHYFCKYMLKTSNWDQTARKVFFCWEGYPKATLIELSMLLLLLLLLAPNGAVAATLMQYIRQLPSIVQLVFDWAAFLLKYVFGL